MTRRRRWLVVLIAAAAIAVVFVVGLVPRLVRRAAVKRDTAEMTVPNVTVVQPQRTAPATTIVLPASAQAYLDAPIFARIGGYLERWFVDIGARVTKGQLLARIAVPEVEQQLQQARSTLAVSKANLEVARSTAGRFTALSGTKAVSPQEVETAVGSMRANEATVKAGEATVRQLEQSLEFARIRAPFDGYVTVRNVDVGDLINAGSSTVRGTELFHIVQPDKLRVYAGVPEAYAAAVTPALTAEVTFTAFAGETFTGTLVRTAKAIDPTTRILNVELLVDNAHGQLFAGGYASVRLNLPGGTTWRLPVEALVFRTKLAVATVVGGVIAMKQIVPGRDHGEWIEVVGGLTGDEQIVLNPSDSIADGQQVRIVPHQAEARR